MNKEIAIKIVQNNDELIKSFILRGIIFIGEQNVDYPLEFDSFDYAAIHVLGTKNDNPIAAARIRFFSEYAKLERICVMKEHRCLGIGSNLTNFLIDYVELMGLKTIRIHAQSELEKFYKYFGFYSIGTTFKEAGMEHVLMEKICNWKTTDKILLKLEINLYFNNIKQIIC